MLEKRGCEARGAVTVRFAVTYNFHELKNEATKYIERRFAEVIISSDFSDLTYAELLDLIRNINPWQRGVPGSDCLPGQKGETGFKGDPVLDGLFGSQKPKISP